MIRYLMPFVVFLGMSALFFYVLTDENYDPHELPSALIDKPAPDFVLTKLHTPQETFSPAEAKGKVWLLNVWASWCPSCRTEHPTFMEIARKGEVALYGLNYKDQPNNAKQWLKELGDPYVLSVSDLEGNVGIDYGVYGAPETYIIDQQGIIRYKHVGPVTWQVWKEEILPKIQELKG